MAENEIKIYKQEKKLDEFFENSFYPGVAITKGDKVLFAQNYKSMKKAEEAYDTFRKAHEIFGVRNDNETIISMWNGQWFFNEKCFITEEYFKKCIKFHKKWFDFIHDYFSPENKQRKGIKEVRFNQKNYDLMSYKSGGLNYLNGYPVIIDETVTDDFKVIYKDKESEEK